MTQCDFNSEYEDKVPLNSIVGSVTDCGMLEKACRKVSSVFHVAGLISFGTAPDIDAMFQINVNGKLQFSITV